MQGEIAPPLRMVNLNQLEGSCSGCHATFHSQGTGHARMLLGSWQHAFTGARPLYAHCQLHAYICCAAAAALPSLLLPLPPPLQVCIRRWPRCSECDGLRQHIQTERCCSILARSFAQARNLTSCCCPVAATAAASAAAHCPLCRRYVSDDDRVAINVMDYASSSSAGAHRAPSTQQSTSSSPGSNTPTIRASSSSAQDASSGSTHLALSSGIYGSLQDADVFGSGSMDSVGPRTGTGQSGSTMQQQQLHYDACMPLPPYAMRAGPREDIYFDPATVTAAIVTTGKVQGGGFINHCSCHLCITATVDHAAYASGGSADAKE